LVDVRGSRLPRIIAQLALVWLVACVVTAAAVQLVIVWARTASETSFLGTVVGAVALLVLALVAIGRWTPNGSPLTRTQVGRFAWALLVTVGGTAAFALAVSLRLAQADLVHLVAVAGGAYAVVAAILAGRWYVTLPALAVTVTGIVLAL
jgi:hypothetical protein